MSVPPLPFTLASLLLLPSALGLVAPRVLESVWTVATRSSDPALGWIGLAILAFAPLAFSMLPWSEDAREEVAATFTALGEAADEALTEVGTALTRVVSLPVPRRRRA
jgi:hypothetical protein